MHARLTCSQTYTYITAYLNLTHHTLVCKVYWLLFFLPVRLEISKNGGTDRREILYGGTYISVLDRFTLYGRYGA